jgi:hypothetical protein
MVPVRVSGCRECVEEAPGRRGPKEGMRQSAHRFPSFFYSPLSPHEPSFFFLVPLPFNLVPTPPPYLLISFPSLSSIRAFVLSTTPNPLRGSTKGGGGDLRRLRTHGAVLYLPLKHLSGDKKRNKGAFDVRSRKFVFNFVPSRKSDFFFSDLTLSLSEKVDQKLFDFLNTQGFSQKLIL